MSKHTTPTDTQNRQMNTTTVVADTEVVVPDAVLEDARDRAQRFDADLSEVLRNHIRVQLTFRDESGETVADW